MGFWLYTFRRIKRVSTFYYLFLLIMTNLAIAAFLVTRWWFRDSAPAALFDRIAAQICQ